MVGAHSGNTRGNHSGSSEESRQAGPCPSQAATKVSGDAATIEICPRMVPNRQPGASQVSSQKLFRSLETATLLGSIRLNSPLRCRKKKADLAAMDALLSLARKPLLSSGGPGMGLGVPTGSLWNPGYARTTESSTPHTFRWASNPCSGGSWGFLGI